MNEIEKYMTTAEAAHLWGMSRHTINSKLKPSLANPEEIERMISRGLIKPFRHPDVNRTEWIISKEAMREWFGDSKV